MATSRPSRAFRRRLLLLVGGLVVLAQAGTFAGILTTLNRDVRSAIAQSLVAGGDTAERWLEQRRGLLANGADVLVADFGFRSSIASGDEDTIRSALRNNIERIGADLAVLYDPDGRPSVTTAAGAFAPQRWRDALDRAKRASTTPGTAMMSIEDIAYQYVIVPVRAPTVIGWLFLGFALDDVVAADLAAQLDLQVTFGQRVGAGWRETGSTLDAALRAGISSDLLRPGAGAAARGSPEAAGARLVTLGAEEWMSFSRPIDGGDEDGGQVRVLLQRPLGAALAPYYALRDRLALISLFTLALGLLGAAWMAHGVARPLAALNAAARRILDGHYSDAVDFERDDEFGELATTFVHMQDAIAEREARIRHQAFHDELTGLANQRLGLDRLGRAIEAAGPRDENVSVLVCGVDGHRRCVETLGHDVGERLLVEIARRLGKRVRSAEGVARLGDDEFLVIAANVDDSGARRLAQELVEIAGRPFAVGEAQLAPAISIGIATWPRHGDGASALVRRGGIALTDARERLAAIACYTDGRDEAHRRQLTIVADLKQAVERDELVLHFQPKIDLADLEVRSAEALVRWIHPQLGFMPPDEFISLAERSGNITLLSDWVVKAAVRQIADWGAEGLDVTVAVNLSALDLKDRALPDRVMAALTRHEVPPNRLVIEVTESAITQDIALALEILQDCRSRGIAISIDDFGTGQSSLAKLKDMPADELKIDRAFIVGIEHDTVESMIVGTIIELGHGLGMKVTTEGIESATEWAVLKALGSDTVQGYLVSRPLLAPAFGEWLRAHRAGNTPVDQPRKAA